MVSLLAVFAALTAAYIGVLVWAGRTESERIQVVGPLIMVRTQAGKKLIDRIAKQRWLGGMADVFIVLTVVSGLAMVLLVAWQNTLLFTHTEQVAQNPPQVEQTLAIPGVNPAIPVGYGLFALVVALVIHEGGHGVLARYANLEVKSLGLLFLVLPVGAFVEPDEEELHGASLQEKLRMFASGPGPNMVLGAVTVLLFAQMFVPAMAPARDDGVAILRADEDLPAYEAGLRPGDFVTGIEGFETPDSERFSAVLEHHATTPLPDGAKFTGAGDGTQQLSYNVTVPADAEPGPYNVSGTYRFSPAMDEFSGFGNATVDVTCPEDGSPASGVQAPDGAGNRTGDANVTRRTPAEVSCGETFTVELTLDPPEGTEFWAIVESTPETWATESLVGGLRGDTLDVTYVRDDETATTTVEPRDKFEEFTRRTDGPIPDSFRGVPFFGVSPSDPESLEGITDRLQHPFEEMGLQGGLFYLALPFLQLQPFPSSFHDVFAVTGVLSGLGGGFWVLANSLYWLFWINVVLGTFNALPLGPLDGGHMFRHWAHWMFRRGKDVSDDDIRVFKSEDSSPTFVGRTPAIQDTLDEIDRKVKLLTHTVGWGLLVLVVAPLIVPNFL